MRSAGRRPRAVIVAAGLGLVAGGLLVVLHVWTLLALLDYSSGRVARADTGSYTAMYALLACRVGTGGLYIWGAIAALWGRSRVILLSAAVLHLVFAVVLFAAAAVGSHQYGPATTALVVLDLLVAVPVLLLTLLPSNRAFFAAR